MLRDDRPALDSSQSSSGENAPKFPAADGERQTIIASNTFTQFGRTAALAQLRDTLARLSEFENSRALRIVRGLMRALPRPYDWTQLPRLAYWLMTFKLGAKIREGIQIERVRNSGLFDAAYYLRENSDVACTGIEPATHFVRYGAREGRKPHPLFDTAYYRTNNPDVARSLENPLLHFLALGGVEGRSPHTFFDCRFYLGAHPDARAAKVNPLLHYLTYGAIEGANPHLLFDTAYYAQQNPDVLRTGVNPLIHYVTTGEAQGRSPHPIWDFKCGTEYGFQSDLTEDRLFKMYQTCMQCKSGKPDSLLAHFQWDTYEVAHTLKLTDLGQNAHTIARELTFETPAEIVVSIVVPVYNKAPWTLRCLHSLRLSAPNVPYELIVVDDGSTDETPELIGTIKGLCYVRNAAQLGFLRSCNHGAGFARGKFIVLLNNDTVIMPNWLPALLATFENFKHVGLAGSKLLYPNGSLQEAGGVVWRDGSGMNFGRQQDPARPEFNYARDVDYCSGASIMLPLALWKELGGFDELFVPAYYEDTDLAFRVRQAGYRVIYQPLSRVIHFEGISSGTDLASGVKRHQALNLPKFLKRWENELRQHGMPGEMQLHFLDRRVKGHALVFDESTPTPDQDSGSADVVNYLKLLKHLNYRVTFIPVTYLSNLGRYTKELQGLGIECLYFPYSNITEYIKAAGPTLDLALFFRYSTATLYLDLVRASAPRAKVILETVDLHFLRVEREEDLAGLAAFERQARKVKDLELRAIAKSDASIVLSQFEFDLARKLVPGAKLALIPIVRELPGRLAACAGRRDVVFIGGFRHTPNVDAVKWLVQDIWPLVRTRLAGCRLLIVGSSVTSEIQQLHNADVSVVGFVEDLTEIFKACRLTVAPLRYGAGMKGKVVTSLSYGVPCVATPVATEGTGLCDGAQLLVAETPQAFADAIVRLYTDDALWNSISDAGFQYASQHFSLAEAERKFTLLLDELFAEKNSPGSAGVLSR